MEYCCHLWAGAPSCYLKLLDKSCKNGYAGHIGVGIYDRYKYYFGRCLSEQAQLFPLS